MPNQVEILAPDVLSPQDGATMQQWLVSVGDDVYAGERLAEIVVPGVLVSVAAPCSGRLTEIVTSPLGAVLPGQILGWIKPESA